MVDENIALQIAFRWKQSYDDPKSPPSLATTSDADNESEHTVSKGKEHLRDEPIGSCKSQVAAFRIEMQQPAICTLQ
jgi:hypothetical protein